MCRSLIFVKFGFRNVPSFPEPQRARASCLGRDRAGRSNRTESAETRCAQRRHGLGRPPRNPASTSHGRWRSGVHLFGRASYWNLKSHNPSLLEGLRSYLPVNPSGRHGARRGDHRHRTQCSLRQEQCCAEPTAAYIVAGESFEKLGYLIFDR